MYQRDYQLNKIGSILHYFTMVDLMILYSLLTDVINYSVHLAFNDQLILPEKTLPLEKSLGVLANSEAF
jgi:hypothetical protein